MFSLSCLDGTGTSLEVSSVCNILAALGILETISDADAAAAAPTPRHDEELHKLNDYLRVKFENTPFEPSNRSETFVDPSAEGGTTDELTAAQLLGHEGDDAGHHDASLHPTDDLLDPEVVNLLMANTSPLTTGPEPEMPDNVHASLLDESVSDDFLAGLSSDVGRTFDFPAASTATAAAASAAATATATAAEKKPSAEASSSEAQPMQPPTPSSSQTPRRQYQSGRKFWALRDGRLLPHHMLAMVSNPAPIFLQWMQTCHTYASALEIEEKMLRRLCSDIDVALPANTLREGTKYVQHASVRPPLPSAAPFRSESTQQRRVESQVEQGDAVVGTRDLLDGRRQLTGDMLIDKIFKSKRQRSKATSSASNGAATFSASHLQSLRSVCQKTEAFLKAYAVEESGGEENGKHRKPKAVAAESISFAEYVRSMHMQNAQVNPNAILSGMASASNVLVAGVQPVITAASVRRNAQPHQLSLTTPEFGLDADGVKSLQYPIQLPDLAVSTIEVPWRSLVTEFSLVVLDDAGEFVDGLSNKLLSHAEQSVEQSASSSATATTETAATTERGGSSTGKPSSKKRSRSSSQLAHEDGQPDQVSVHHVLKRKIISEVLAPGVRLSTTKAAAGAGPVAAGDGDDDEDTSDGHYLERHDAVLKTMRERWALLNKLKHEVRRDQTTPGSAMKRQRLDSEQLSIPGVTEESEPAAHEPPAVSLTPLIKKRGRPPKFHKSFSASKGMNHDAS